MVAVLSYHGYTYNIKRYCGKEEDRGQCVPAKIVMHLTDKLLKEGRTVITDHTSIELATKLLGLQTHLVGTLGRILRHFIVCHGTIY